MATYRIRHKNDTKALYLQFVCQGKQAIKEIYKNRISDSVKDEYVVEKEEKSGEWTPVTVRAAQKTMNGAG